MPEINIKNEAIKKEYEEVLLHAKYRDPKTVRAVWKNINLFEKFTDRDDFINFDKDQAIGFKVWLEKQENKKGELLSLSTVANILHNLKQFFEWFITLKENIRKIDGRAVQYLRLSDNAKRASRASREKIVPSLQEAEKALTAMPDNTDIEKRDKAIFAFLIITGVRDKALITLKVKDFSLADKTIYQDPKHVKTKFRKGILTRMVSGVLPFAEQIFLDWFKFITIELKFKPNDPMFPNTLMGQNEETYAFVVKGLSREHWVNTQSICNICKNSFHAVELPYYNPHLFRNMILTWGLDNCSQKEFKALSQNIGHEQAMTSYNSYAKLTEFEQIRAIVNIGTTKFNVNDYSPNEQNEIIQALMVRN